MVRPVVYTNEQMIAALEQTQGLVYLAAKALGCRPDTIYTRAKKSEVVASAIKNERGLIVDVAEHKLFLAIKRGKPWALALVLKTLGKDRGYVEKSIVQNEEPVRERVVESEVESAPDDAGSPAVGSAAPLPPK